MAHVPFASAPSSYTACSVSTSSYPVYDVFISHRGPDVKKTFAGHLYQRLRSRGLLVFLDKQELQSGHQISFQIAEAIKVASVHVVIFSPHYAESTWCLEELVLILKSRATMLPVFYGVKPLDLRWTTGSYAEALRKHEEKRRCDIEKIQGWKNALSTAANISGFELEACNGDEVELLEEVVQRVLKEVPKPPLYVAKYKIGLQEKLEDFEKTVLSQLGEKGRPEAKVVGIVGVGGIGKTTLVKEFFNNRRSNYKVSSFLFDMRENATAKSINLLQSKLIKDLKDIDIKIDRWEEGIGMIEKNLKSCHALIILDNVDHIDQLDAFLPIKPVLDPNSLILVTSRDKHVLRSARIPESSIYHLKGLNRSHSLELFCCHAFFQPHPVPEFEDLVNGFINACDGLPLSLEVFGALLCQENDKSYWEEQLNELQMLPPEIHRRLKISYDSLNPEEQQIFLDIAFFAIGENKDKWIRIWVGSGWKGSVGLRNLENRCLVEVDGENIKMHDHLRDMGRSIAEERSMPRRVWCGTTKNVYDLLEQSSSVRASIVPTLVTDVRGIKISRRSTLTDTWEEGLFRSKSKMPLSESFRGELFSIRKLQLLEAEGDFVKGILSEVRSPNLLWLCWNMCPLDSLPSWIPMHDLRVLEVDGSKLKTLWGSEYQAPLQLRELNIDHAPLLEFPNSIGQLKHLEKITLDYSWTGLWPSLNDLPQLATLPEEFCLLRSLKYLKLAFCHKLQILPTCFGNLTNLQHIDLYECQSLKMLPNSLGNLRNLHYISLAYCGELQTLPDSLGNLTHLQEINLEGCKSLEMLPDSLGTLTNLHGINMSGCLSLKTLPASLENLTNLQHIRLDDCESLKMLPNSVENLTNLKNIDLSGCCELQRLPHSFGNLTNLQEINLEECKCLKMLPESVGNLTNLKHINMNACQSLNMLPDSFSSLTNIQYITMSDCESLEMLPDSFGSLTNLRHITLSHSKRLKMLPNSFGNLTNLQHIDLYGCESLKMLPDSFGNLRNLRYVTMSHCKSLQKIPSSFGNLTNLQSINMYGSEKLEMLPTSFGNLINLQHIDMQGCQSLKMLPDSFGSLTNLKYIRLCRCESLEQMLPNILENFINLQYIDISHSSKLQMPSNSLGNLLQLKHLHLSGCTLIISEETLGNITTLECLDLSSCLQMQVLPSQVVHQKYLQKLNLLGTNIKELPSAPIVCLSNLEVLNLGSPLLKVLPQWIGDLISLRKLQLRGCRILERLPDSVGQLAQLKVLRLHGSQELKCLPDSVGLLNQLRVLDISNCGIQYLPPAVMKMNNLKILRVCGCPLRDLPFKNIQGEGEPESAPRRELDSSIHTAMIHLEVIHLYLTEISKVSFPQGVCPNLKSLSIRRCNSLVEVGALPTTLIRINLRGCGALRKIDGLYRLAKLAALDITGCCALCLQAVPGLETIKSLKTLKSDFETCYPNEEGEEEMEIEDANLQGVLWCDDFCVSREFYPKFH